MPGNRLTAISDWAEWEKQPISELEIRWDCVFNKKFYRGGCHEEVPFIETFDCYKAEVKEKIEEIERLELTNIV